MSITGISSAQPVYRPAPVKPVAPVQGSGQGSGGDADGDQDGSPAPAAATSPVTSSGGLLDLRV